MLSFQELWEKLNLLDETVEIEAKQGSQVGDSSLETISALSNEPHRNGGYILFGASRKPGVIFPEYDILGVPNPDQLVTDLASRCNTEFNCPIRPYIQQEQMDGKTVVIAYISEVSPQQKPIYILKRGAQRGTYRRIGSADILCSDEDLAYFYQDRTHKTYDESVVEDATFDDLDPEMLNEYRLIRSTANPSASELRLTDEEMVYSLHAGSRRNGHLVPTVSGLLLFGKRTSLRRYFPSMRVDYIRVEGRDWVPDPENRYQAVEILDPLLRSIPRTISLILDDLPKAFHLPAGEDRRQEIPVISRDALREVVVNAVMHRSYRSRGAIQIIRYANRLEIRNPGISLVPDERLGEPGSLTRNEKIAAVLHETDYAEAKGTGIKAVRELMKRFNRTPPFFESDRMKDTFSVTFLFHHLLSPEDLGWLDRFKDLDLSLDDQKALVFAREIGSINSSAYRDINQVDYRLAAGYLSRLEQYGLLEQKGQNQAIYYKPSSKLLDYKTSINPPEETSIISERLNPIERQESVLEFLSNHPSITRRQYEDLFKTSYRQSVRDLAHMVDLGILDRNGPKSATFYTLKKQSRS